ncbi:MAG: ribbon-helix-helix domain-containing protein [Dehalococcoidia bacterium]|nr:ribbon-helix-helix domain-containing protein [Dehalococcoidia bacterium]
MAADKMVHFSVVMPPSLIRRLDAYAAKEGRSRSNAIRRAVIALLGKAK